MFLKRRKNRWFRIVVTYITMISLEFSVICSPAIAFDEANMEETTIEITKQQVTIVTPEIITEEITIVTSETTTEETTIEVTSEKESETLVSRNTSTSTSASAITANSIDSYELEIMAHLINGETGDQSDSCQRAAGSVVMNRVKHPRYNNSVKGVVFERGQYACTWDGNYEKKPSERAYANARWVLEGNNRYAGATVNGRPVNVIYQSQFVQGDGIYEKVGTEYFCFEYAD